MNGEINKVIKLCDGYLEMAMACTCVNEDGTPSQYCRGCTKATILNVEEQKRAQEDGFTNKQLQQITDIVRQILCGSPMLDTVWQNGFIKGFDIGVKHGQENCCC